MSEKVKSQKQRFIDAAKEIEVDETGEDFERAFGKIVPPILKERSPPSK